MVDILPKVQHIDDVWLTNSLAPHRKQMNLQFCSGNDLMGHGGNRHSTRSEYVSSQSARRRGYRTHQSKAYNNLRRNYSDSAPSPQFIPAPSVAKYAQRPRSHASRVYINQTKLVECLAKFKTHPTLYADPLQRPFHGQACKCLPFSRNDLSSQTTAALGLRNLLRVSTSNSDRYFLTRKCCYVFHCLNLRTNFNYPDIPNKLIIKDDGVATTLEQLVAEEMEQKGLEVSDKRSYVALMAKYTARANKLLYDMKAALSSTLIRITGYVLFKVFSNLLMSVTVHGGQQDVIQKAAQRETPIIYLPLHRSHVDYLFVTWVLFNRQIPAPIVAAGDNLRIPVFGWLLRGLGGFFIKRRLDTEKSRKDILYRSVLQTYMTHALQAGYNLEFFIEGGRTRTGKPCMPKGGLLSVIVDAYSNGTLEDALIIPIAINYDRLLDGNFIREQMGQSKVPESFWGAVRAIIKVLSTNYGHARIDFGQPFSLREFIQTFKRRSSSHLVISQPQNEPLSGCTPPLSPSPSDESPRLSIGSSDPPPPIPLVTDKGHQRSLSTPASSNHVMLKKTSSNPSSAMNMSDKTTPNLTGARSSSSLFGTEVTEEYRLLIKSLACHIVYDAEQCQAIMSTNAVAWLLSFVYRSGARLSTLTTALDALRDSLKTRKRDTGFSGRSENVVRHAVRLLGPGLVRTELSGSHKSSCDQPDYFIKPVTLLPNIIELNYYASALAPLFAADAVIATSLVSMIDCDLWSYKDCSPNCYVEKNKLMERAVRLAALLENEFLLAPPCAKLEDRLSQALDTLVDMGLLQTAVYPQRGANRWSDDSDDDDDDVAYSSQYKLTPTASSLEVIGAWRNMLAPMLDAYYYTAHFLQKLVATQMPDKKFIQSTQNYIGSLLEKGILRYGESICMDPIRNAVKLFESEAVVESYTRDNIRLLYLAKEFDSEDKLLPFINEIDSYRS